MSMADLIQWGRTAQRTGLLHLSDGQGKEIDVVLRDGSRIDGRLTVRDILDITPVSESEGLRAFKRLLTARVLDFPNRNPPAERNDTKVHA